jgi:hypothetical protein
VISCIQLEEQTKDVLKLKSVPIYNHLMFGEGMSEDFMWNLIYTYSVIIIIKLLWLIGSLIGGFGVLPQYIFEALGLTFWCFLKQICKQIACKLTAFYKNGYHFTKNNYSIMQILPENVKILTWFYMIFAWIS